MKISICIPYYNRRTLLLNTLCSIEQSQYKNIEVCIVDDGSIEYHDISDLPSTFSNLNIRYHKFTPEEKKWSNIGVIPLNKAISMASGDIIMLLGAECFLYHDIILDVINNIQDNMYRVYSTYSLNTNETPYNFKIYNNRWYQHSIYNNHLWNFCVALTKKDMEHLGGFDERYAYGYDYGDVEFLDRVKRKNMNIVVIDKLVLHQWHEHGENYYSLNNELRLKNKNIYLNYTQKETFINIKNSFINKTN